MVLPPEVMVPTRAEVVMAEEVLDLAPVDEAPEAPAVAPEEAPEEAPADPELEAAAAPADEAEARTLDDAELEPEAALLRMEAPEAEAELLTAPE